MDEKIVETISNKVQMLVSLARILENNYNNNDDLNDCDLWALTYTIKENSQSLLDYIKGLQSAEQN